MNVLASTIELGAHPATALLVGGIAAAILRGSLPQLPGSGSFIWTGLCCDP